MARTPGDFDLVVIAASRGGPLAYQDLLARLPADFRAPIAIVQHRASSPATRLAEVLDRRTTLRVVNARHEQALAPGTVYVAPADRQVRLDDAGRLVLDEATASRCRADPLFESAATQHGARTIAVVLTGSLDDGAAGARAVKGSGGRVLVQDPREAQAAGMPLAALSTGCVDHVLPVAQIASALSSFVMTRGSAALFAVPSPHWVFERTA